MAIEVIPYAKSWKSQWDEFVQASNNGTMFHLQRFLDYHPPDRFQWNHLLFVEKGEIIALLPAALQGSTLESPIGASYGSFVTKEISFEKSLALVDCFSDYCREKNIERTLLTAAPFIYQRTFTQDIDYALAYRGFSYDKHYISHAIDLADKDFIPRFQSTARRYIRKYLREKTVQIEISDDYELFYPILLGNKKKHGVVPTHTLEELKRLKELLPDHLILFLAKDNGKPIAGSLVFHCNQKVALCFYNMLLYEYEHVNPIYSLMYEVIEWASDQKCRWVDIGVSQDTHAENQMTPAMSLINFKEKFDARGILRSTFYKRFI